MLVTAFRAIIIYVILIIGMRLMGKRQIGEFQPFELIIMLIIAELAAVPMADISIPIFAGLVPIFVIFVTHLAITIISNKSLKFRKALNGTPQIIINENGIDSNILKEVNMNVNDLLESIREQGYFTIEEIKFAVLETNGKISVLPDDSVSSPEEIPVSLIVNEEFVEDNFQMANITKKDIEKILNKINLIPKKVIYMSKNQEKYFIQPYNAKYIIIGDENEG